MKVKAYEIEHRTPSGTECITLGADSVGTARFLAYSKHKIEVKNIISVVEL